MTFHHGTPYLWSIPRETCMDTLSRGVPYDTSHGVFMGTSLGKSPIHMVSHGLFRGVYPAMYDGTNHHMLYSVGLYVFTLERLVTCPVDFSVDSFVIGFGLGGLILCHRYAMGYPFHGSIRPVRCRIAYPIAEAKRYLMGLLPHGLTHVIYGACHGVHRMTIYPWDNAM